MLAILSLIPQVISLVRELFSLARELKLKADRQRVVDFVVNTSTTIKEIRAAKTTEEKQKLAAKLAYMVKEL